MNAEKPIEIRKTIFVDFGSLEAGKEYTAAQDIVIPLGTQGTERDSSTKIASIIIRKNTKFHIAERSMMLEKILVFEGVEVVIMIGLYPAEQISIYEDRQRTDIN